MDAPSRFSFERRAPQEKYDEHARHTKAGTTFISSGVDEEPYKPIAKYEGIHRYDPEYEWEPTEERKVVRKVRIGTKVMFAISFLLTLCILD
jgi:hypothetical protein